MITRPLDLAARLRPPPRDFGGLFLVNGALIALFFFLFGSRFVLAPGIGVEFALPEFAGAAAHAQPTTHHITMLTSGQVLTSDGLRTKGELPFWLREQAKVESAPSLLVQINAALPIDVENLTDVLSAAQAAGFRVVVAAGAPGHGARQAGPAKQKPDAK